MLRSCRGGVLSRTMTYWKIAQYHRIPIVDAFSRFYFSTHRINATQQHRRYSTDASISYEKKTPVEHVLLRPGMYIGATEFIPLDTWVFNQSKQTMEKKAIVYNPALLKIFDEILVNAADNKQRDPTMSHIHVSVWYSLKDALTISVTNDGRGIPIQLHKDEGIYIPELIFGHLLTGSNFDDKQSRLTGGSHGYGAKLTNIFSKSFTVETYDHQTGLVYKQKWSNNMSSVMPPSLEKRSVNGAKGVKSYTKVTFVPDLQRFKLDSSYSATTDDRKEMIQQMVLMFHRRSMDIAACIAPTEVRFDYNDVAMELPIRSFEEYIKIFKQSHRDDDIEDASTTDRIDASSDGHHHESSGEGKVIDPPAVGCYCRVNKRWEVGVRLSTDDTFESMSFVNNVWTSKGGTHVNLIATQIVKSLEQSALKQGIKVSPTAIRNKLHVFVNCQIENPSFDGQTKDSLSSKAASFGSTCKLPEKFLKHIEQSSGILESVLRDIATKDKNALLNKTKSSKKQFLDIPKLDDAHRAGSKDALDCTLILTEGDSAKALAVSGLEVVGRELFGVLPLRGKILNVRCATRSQLAKNEEVMHICKALGLDFSKTYENGLEQMGLRYGKVMIMCDQDTDGSHIKGLVINLFHFFWPALLRYEGFLQQFITPIVKAKRGTGKSAEVMQFYSMPEYKQWLAEMNIDDGSPHGGGDKVMGPTSNSSSSASSRYSIKYYKGLGTNTASEGREYFKQLLVHRKLFQGIVEAGGNAIDLAFSKARVSDRKQWLTQTFSAGSFINPRDEKVSYQDFIDKELIQFSYSDLQRSIPNVIDGLKPSQRKVLYGCFKKKLVKEEAKVVQIAGYIAEHTAYHHGETSLHATIINMAQDFVGSNNVPFLAASGQFGTRALGGKDSASPRYVFTRLNSITRLLFPEEDDSFLEHIEEDGMQVEPKYYIPVIPTLLLNGSDGIGTGWSTSIPTYNLIDVVDEVRHRILGIPSPKKHLEPYVVGFKGSISASKLEDNSNRSPSSIPSPSTYQSTGIIRRVGATKLEITELPVRVWTEDYKHFLYKLVQDGSIKEVKESHSTDDICFTITATKLQIDQQEKQGLIDVYRLKSNISLSNMHAFDQRSVIHKYSSPEDIIDAHYPVRYEAYRKRKQSLERLLQIEEARSRSKSNFILDILSGAIDILSTHRSAGRSEYDIARQLKSRGYPEEKEFGSLTVHDQTTEGKHHSNHSTSSNLQGSDHGDTAVYDDIKFDYSYLLDMPINSLTDERSTRLKQRAEEASEKLASLRAKTPADLWLSDLDKITQAYSALKTGQQ